MSETLTGAETVTEWRTFYAKIFSPTANRLVLAQYQHRLFAEDFQRFLDSVPNNFEVVAFAEPSGGWASEEIEELGFQRKDPIGQIQSSEWNGARGAVLTRFPNAYKADPRGQFYATQKALLERSRVLPHPGFEWTLGDGGDKANHPAYAHVLKEVSDGMDKTFHVPRSLWTSVNAECRRLHSGWVIKTPVNPRTGRYYRPPGAEELDPTQFEVRMNGYVFASLPAYTPSGTEALAKLKKYMGDRYFGTFRAGVTA